MSFAYTTVLGVLGVLVMAEILQLSLQQDTSPPVLLSTVNLAVLMWFSRSSGSDMLISEAEMRSNVAQEVREDYLDRYDALGLFRMCWFDMSDTDQNRIWDEEERMQVFNDYAGEDRQLSFDEALSFAAVHYDITTGCYQDMLRRNEERRQRTASRAN